MNLRSYVRILAVAILGLSFLQTILGLFNRVYELTIPDFKGIVHSGQIKEMEIFNLGHNLMKIIGITYDGQRLKVVMPFEDKYTNFVLAKCPKVRFSESVGEDVDFLDKVRFVLLNILVNLIIYSAIFSIGRNFTKEFKIEASPVRLSDVGGLRKEKGEVMFAIDILKNLGAIREQNIDAPKGILFFGPPGNGKTLLAKAIAGEAGVNFIYASGSEFDEVFVGIGASRIRDMFVKAKKHKPAIIFIDEIDSIGGRRTGFGRQHSGTINQLLCELDGFKGTDGIMFICSTNMPEALDDALLRPGRIDKKIMFGLPSFEDREDIARIKLERLKVAPEITPRFIATATSGFSGSEIASLANEAAICALKGRKPMITLTEFEEAFERILLGAESSIKLSEKETRVVAFHEVGHALTAMYFRQVGILKQRPYKVSVVPRTKSLGVFILLPDGDEVLRNKEQVEANIAVTLGGKAAELIFFGEEHTTTGVTADLKSATRMTNDMFRRFGMLGKNKISFYEHESEFYKKEADEHIQAKINELFLVVCNLLENNRELVKTIVEELMEKREITFRRLEEIIDNLKIMGPTAPGVV